MFWLAQRKIAHLRSELDESCIESSENGENRVKIAH